MISRFYFLKIQKIFENITTFFPFRVRSAMNGNLFIYAQNLRLAPQIGGINACFVVFIGF